MLKPPASRLDSLQLPETHQTFSGFLSSEFPNGKIKFWHLLNGSLPKLSLRPSISDIDNYSCVNIWNPKISNITLVWKIMENMFPICSQSFPILGKPILAIRFPYVSPSFNGIQWPVGVPFHDPSNSGRSWTCSCEIGLGPLTLRQICWESDAGWRW